MTNAPFGNCKAAELHLGNRLQSCGGLVVIDKRSQLICACSSNIAQFTGKGVEALLGQNWSVSFRADQIPSLFRPIGTPGQELALVQKAEFNQKMMLLASHSLGNLTLVEIEPSHAEAFQFAFAERVAYLHALADTATPESAAGLLMQTVAGIIGFDRVMLYRFLPEWHGEVIAERLRAGVPGYLGLRFPATDLPANARRLYLVNWQRVIADVEAPTVAIVTLPGCEPIDFTFSQLRAVHPVHIQYLKNIGVEASFSLSIVVAGQLWGLVVCHHLTAKALSLEQRQLCEEVARTTSLHMTDMAALRREESRSGYREALAAILGALRTPNGNKRDIASQLAQIGQLFHAQGTLAHLDDQDFHSGSLPDEISLSALRNSLENHDKGAIAARRTISPVLAKYPALVRFASGSLYIPLTGEDFLLLMRPEQIETVLWAGRPQGLADAGEELAQLTPRASFQKWSEQVKGSSEAWDEAEMESASRAREMLIDYLDQLQLENMALRDPLTGLANRPMFEKAIQEAIRLAIKDNMVAAVFMLDLDKFKAVNDTLGHAAGDELLIEVGKRLTALMRARDVVARLGGDEFGIVGFDLRRADDAQRTAERILREIRRPFMIQGHSLEIGVSIGASMCPVHAIEHAELLVDADLALYQAKNAGRNTFKTFTHDMVADTDQRESIRDGILAAMQDGSLFLVYQPIVNAKTRALQSFETFARWQHATQGELPASEFLPLIEQCQLLTQFAEWGIRQALIQGKLWLRKALPLVPVSVNLSGRQFLSLDLVGLCGALARELDIGLEWLRFDLDETALQADFGRAAAKIATLSEIGILTSIDHFGQGLVPLNRICEVRINQLKMAGRYFEWSKDTTRNDALIAIIHEVGRVLRIPLVATQIENEAMELRASVAGIEYLQGRLISRELKPDAAEQWLRDRASHEEALQAGTAEAAIATTGAASGSVH
jgi:diguanylate cyclase (GGDEF)-like protein